MIRYLPFILLFFCSSNLAQTPVNAPEPFDYYLELITELSSKNEEETDFNDLAYELHDLWESPLDLNTAEINDLARLFWLTEIQLNNLIAYVKNQKPLVSLYELAFIPGFDSTLVESIKPFIFISDVRETNKFKKKSEHWLLLRTGKTIEKQAGFRENKFEGDEWKQSLKYKYKYGENISAGFSLEKDAGETVFKKSNKAGPDYYSGYLKINNLGKLKTICLGNYTIGFGQGLVAGPGFALGKSAQAVNLIQKDIGIRPYTSNDENRYFQGVATTLSFKQMDLTTFISYKKVDANVSLRDSIGKVLEVSSLQITGYHSTENEIADENTLSELTSGGRLSFKGSRFKAGISVIHSGFNANIVPATTNYNQLSFKGNNQSNFGIDYKFNFSNTVLFGEEAIDAKGNPAFLNGLTSNIAGRIQFSLLHRFYSKSYHAFYGNAFGENTRIQNEEGLYAGFKMELIKHVNLSFYADFFRFPWLKYGVDGPSYGKEFMVQAEYNTGSIFSAYVHFRYKLKQSNLFDSAEFTNKLVHSEAQRLRFHLSFRAGERISLATRLETGIYLKGNQNDKAFLLYQDFNYSFLKVPVQFHLRYALFNTDSYDSRIYAYESDVLHSFSINSYSNQGQRYYIMLKYSPFRKINFWIKYSQSVYPNERTISSGLYEINGNTRSDIRMQVILKF